MPTVTYLRIPAADDDAMEECKLSVPADLEANLSCLTTTLQDYFRKHGGAMTDDGRAALYESVRAQVAKQNPQGAAPDEKMLGQLALSVTVDIIQLLPATKASNYIGVNMYVDDKGVSKGAPPNRRASGVCTQCGIVNEVRGDAFIARVWDDQEGFERHDFGMKDLASDAPWVLEACARNQLRPGLEQTAKQLGVGQSAGPTQPSEPDLPPDARLERAAALRAAGAERFKAGEHAAAAAEYRAAVSLFEPAPSGDAALSDAQRSVADGARHTCLVNLAACELRLDRPYDALAACDRAVAIDETNAKAWYRRGQACMALSQFGAARKDLTRAAKLAPASREVRDELQKAVEGQRARAAF